MFQELNNKPRGDGRARSRAAAFPSLDSKSASSSEARCVLAEEEGKYTG